MYIKKATRIVNELTKTKEIQSARESVERVHSQSIDKRSSIIMEPTSSLIPSAQITLDKLSNSFMRSFNKGITHKFMTRSSDSKTLVKPTAFKSLTQKNSFIENKETLPSTQMVSDYSALNRVSCPTSIHHSDSSPLPAHTRNPSQAETAPAEPQSTLKLTKNLHLQTLK